MSNLSRFGGPVDAERFAKAIAVVVAASDVLRTRVTAANLANDHPVVTIASSAPVETEIENVPAGDVMEWALQRRSRPLDLTNAAYASALAVHEDGSLSWLFTLHHTVADAGSVPAICDAVAAAYAGESLDLPSYYRWVRELQRRDDRAERANERANDFWARRSPAARLGSVFGEQSPADTGPSRNKCVARTGQGFRPDLRLASTSY